MEQVLLELLVASFTYLVGKKENIIMCDSKGVICKGRKEGMNQWKEEITVEPAAVKAKNLAKLLKRLIFFWDFLPKKLCPPRI